MSKLSLISWVLSLSQGKALSWWPKRNPKTHYSSHPVQKKKLTNVKTFYVLLLTKAERAAECHISKLKLLSPSAVSPHVERNITILSFTATVLCGQYLAAEAVGIGILLHTCLAGWEWKQGKLSLSWTEAFRLRRRKRFCSYGWAWKLQKTTLFFFYPLNSWSLIKVILRISCMFSALNSKL